MSSYIFYYRDHDVMFWIWIFIKMIPICAIVLHVYYIVVPTYLIRKSRTTSMYWSFIFLKFPRTNWRQLRIYYYRLQEPNNIIWNMNDESNLNNFKIVFVYHGNTANLLQTEQELMNALIKPKYNSFNAHYYNRYTYVQYIIIKGRQMCKKHYAISIYILS